MKTKKEIKDLIKEVSNISDFIVEHGEGEEQVDTDVTCCHTAVDTLYWALGKESVDEFIDEYVSGEKLRKMVRDIEARTGESYKAFIKQSN